MGKSKDLASGAAYQDQTESDTRYVNTAGDSMTGALSVSGGANSAHLTLSGSSNRGLKISTSNPDGQSDGTVILNAQDTESSGVYAKMSFQTAGTERMKIDNAGRVTTPSQPHIFGSPNNSSGSGIANAFYTHSNYPAIGLSFSNSRITVPVAGVYLITYNSIAANGTGREDINVLINGVARFQSLTATNESGYRQNNVANAMKLNANDYIQFDHDDWYSSGGTGYDSWKTASVTLLG